MAPEPSKTETSAGEVGAAPRGVGPSAYWRRLRAEHFHDYSEAALRFWLLAAVAGAFAFVISVLAVLAPSGPDLRHLAIGLLLVATAAWFPIKIPRTRYSVGASDLFIFTILAVLGTPAAVLGAGLEGVIGSWRGTRRLSSRICNPAIGMASMALCGLVFQALTGTLMGFGIARSTALAVAIVPSAIVQFALTTWALSAMVTLKQGRWPPLPALFRSFSWLAAVYLTTALAAGIVQLEADRSGMIVLVLVGLATLVVVFLLRVSLAHNEAEHRQQEVRISEAKREAELNQERFAAAFTNAAIGMAIVDGQGAIVQANRALGDLLGWEAESLIGERFFDALNPADPSLFDWRSRVATERHAGMSLSVELRCTRRDGSELWIALHCAQFEAPGADGNGLIYQLHDITSRQLAESRLQHIAFHDSLTDLPNRANFHEQLGRAVAASRADPEKRFAVMFLDLDRFKMVNDSLGHMHGNEMLREVARRLQQSVRPNDLVARLGGDEFAVLLRDIREPVDSMRLADRMLATLSVPMAIGGTDVVSAASIGLTFSDLGDRTVDELLRDADLAMYEAKAAGRGRVAVFDRTMHALIAERVALETDFRHAIFEGGLTLDFQPLFELEPARLFGFEALARWTHPVRGNIEPTVFVALAEEAGHIGLLTDRVLDMALDQLARWHREAPHMAHLGVSVNISGSDLVRPGFAASVLGRLRHHGVASERLTLEITETVLMSNLEPARDVLAELRRIGVKLAIDDFGTGYSSLSYLSRLPIDYLKIDRSFICEITQGDHHVEILRAVLTLGEALGRCVVAEGIETPEQLAAVRRLGLPVAQGFHLSRPLQPAQVPALWQ